MKKQTGFTLVKIGDDSKVTNLSVRRNVVVVDDLSSVESIVTIGDRGEIVNLDADGNELHTPESYRDKLIQKRAWLKESIDKSKCAIDSIENVLVTQRIKNQLAEALSQPLDSKGEWTMTGILNKTLELSKQVGCGVLTAVISKYLGF